MRELVGAPAVAGTAAVPAVAAGAVGVVLLRRWRGRWPARRRRRWRPFRRWRRRRPLTQIDSHPGSGHGPGVN
ncbi:hypothetical protein A5714_22275 [Mycobacterium sp. E2462]|nr:hypothetical protein A5714_22275 [Mycobacterium sp. E2462]